LDDDVRAFAYLATIMDDGTPQVTPVWFNFDGEFILINSLQGRVKDRNMRKRSRVAIVIHDQKDPFHYIQVRGVVVEMITEGAIEHINELAGKYTGRFEFQGLNPGDVRVIYKILPEKINV
jgi:PPOX class probable F420-dependent enzyme